MHTVTRPPRTRGGRRARRPHRPGCRHCSMVEDYRLTRDAEIRVIETTARDENARPVVFKEWLCAFVWERDPDPSVAS